MIDGSVDGEIEDDDRRSPMNDYQILIKELKHYENGILLEKPSLIVSASNIIQIFLLNKESSHT